MALLENIRVFVRVVELGSLSAAGRHLRLSPAVVSHRLQQLESHLGARLLNRTTRQVQATEQGLVYYQACQDVLGALERAESAIADAGGTPRGSLRVTAPLGFGRRVLAPLLPAFQTLHPEVDVRLRLSDHLIDLLQEAVDCAIRMAVLADSSLVARKIADCPRLLCAAPAYLEAHGRPAVPEDLLEHRCLLLRFAGSQQFRWTLTTPDGPVTLPVAGPLDADDGDVLTEWALDGPGDRAQAALGGCRVSARRPPRAGAARLPARARGARRALPAPPPPAGQGQGVRRLHGRARRPRARRPEPAAARARLTFVWAFAYYD